VAVKLLRSAAFDQAALLHQPNAVSQGKGHLPVARGQQRGHPRLPLHPPEMPAKFLAVMAVQPGKGFFDQQQGRGMGQCAREGHAKLLPARQLGRPALA
jgi:hypothetical protein